MVTMKQFETRSEWLEGRKNTIGGSDAAAVLGMSPWMTNVGLWDQKTGRAEHKEVRNDLVTYGQEAEQYLRQLFSLDFPEIKVFYEENNLFLNDKFPWAHASLDSWLEDKTGRRGVLEIKTASPMSSIQLQKWRGRIPDYYYIQVLHEMAVYDADFAIVKAQLKRVVNGDLLIEARHYSFERDEDEISYLMKQEEEFYKHIESNTRPGLILPEF